MMKFLLILLVLSPALLPAADLSGINDFAYQLQGYPADLSDLKNNSFDLIVMDYSSDGSGAGEFSSTDISSIRTSGPCGGKIVVAYLSIGEAEDYRFYWDNSWVDNHGRPVPGVAPSWLGPVDPDWPGNYKVRYWDPNWQQVVFSYIDRIIAQGFDGIYLDIVDGFEFWGPHENGGNDERRDSAKLMVDFVESIANYARVTKGVTDFIVIPQNGANIIADYSYPDSADPVAEAALQKSRYFPLINAIGAEDTYFYGHKNNNNGFHPQNDTIVLLNEFRDGSKKVLLTDYVTKKKKVKKFYTVARDAGFIPYATIRDLDRLVVNAAYPPDCN
jgi:cysteinyl-tRNA synthetase, unknown class